MGCGCCFWVKWKNRVLTTTSVAFALRLCLYSSHFQVAFDFCCIEGPLFVSSFNCVFAVYVLEQQAHNRADGSMIVTSDRSSVWSLCVFYVSVVSLFSFSLLFLNLWLLFYVLSFSRDFHLFTENSNYQDINLPVSSFARAIIRVTIPPSVQSQCLHLCL